MLEPTWDSEFEVQAWLWWKLREIGINVRGEVKVRIGDTRSYCRFDLAEFDANGRLIGAVEIKARPVNHKTAGGWLATRQGRRYSEMGIPVRLVCGLDEAALLVDECKKSCRLFSKQEAA